MSTLKVGQIVENYQGKFAKVLTEEPNGRYGLSAWVQKKEAAEVETTAVHFLNQYGLSQVLKAAKAPAKEEKEEKKAK